MSFHDPLTLKLSLREKFAYGVGDFGSNLMLCIGSCCQRAVFGDRFYANGKNWAGDGIVYAIRSVL